MSLMLNKNLNSRYHIIKHIASGGFGATYLAEDTMLPGKPKCLVKQLQPTSRDSKSLKKARRLFQKEAEILQKLGTHPRIPQLLAYFEEDQEFFIVQQFIEGHTLSKELEAKRSWSEDKVVELLEDCLEILEFIHSHNVIHRDIKPDNLIRRRVDNKLVLVDFGAVKEILGSHRNITQATTSAVGTVWYMPVEQALGQPTLNSDIYSLGISAIQAISGISPIELQINMLNMQGDEQGKNTWHSRTRVSPKLAEIIAKMIHYDFKQRYQSAREVLQDLHSLKSASLSSPLESNRVKIPLNLPRTFTQNWKNISHASTNPQSVSNQSNLSDLPPNPAYPGIEKDLDATKPALLRELQNKFRFNTLTALIFIFTVIFLGGAAFWVVRRPIQTQLAMLEEIEVKYYQEKKYQQCYQKLEKQSYLDNKEIQSKKNKLYIDCRWEAALDLVKSENYSEAIATVSLIPKHLANQQKIQEKIDEWSQDILNQANKLYQQKPDNFDVAVAMIDSIPDNSMVKKAALTRVEQWIEDKKRIEAEKVQKRQLSPQSSPAPRTISKPQRARQQIPKSTTPTRKTISKPQVARQQQPQQEVINLCQEASALGNCH